ncbi:MAG: hypothetical protein P4L76_01750 [Beijerinckiaceae bacterium]|nr:hypothetical protein [Beijerinckiaceae bacterium]
MFFNIDADEGGSIRGWLALDNPSAIPVLIIVIPDREEIRLEANILRSDIRELGIHSTGQVGFNVTADLVPDLDQIDEITIVEAETRLPMFRRFQIDKHIEKKLFLFDCSVMPQRLLLSALLKHFTLSYVNAERFPLETMLVVINNSFSKSLLMVGRSNFNRYASLLNNAGYVRAALLRDPFEELAERLLFLRILSKPETSNLSAMYTTGIESLAAFARGLPLDDQKALTSAFRAVTVEQRQALMSPMTRVFGCDFDESPHRRHLPLALENLATMDVVGTRARFGAFKDLLTGVLGANVLGDSSPTNFAPIQTLAASLSRIGIVADLLEHDLELYSYVNDAVAAGFEDGGLETGRDPQTI